MTDHLSLATLNALADGELSAEQLAAASEHLAGCPACTSDALIQTMLKAATAKAGHRYTPPPQLQDRLSRLSASEAPYAQASSVRNTRGPARGVSLPLWATAFALLFMAFAGLLWMQRSAHRTAMLASDSAALATEIGDEHVATLAANLPPQVLSSDRHTVKPWFQGKIPFSFNLPENLPQDTMLDGANLTYLHNQPAAQLLYSIGRHRVSVFVQAGTSAAPSSGFTAEHAGFHIKGFRTEDLVVVGVSDVDPTRLTDLVDRIEQAQK